MKLKFTETGFLGFVTAVCLVLISFWTADPELRVTRDDYGNPTSRSELVFRQLPIKNLQAEAIKPVVAGEDLAVKTMVIRSRSCPTRIERIIVDSARYRFVLPDIDFAQSPGKPGLDEYIQDVPTHPKLAAGPAILTMLVTWNCNPMDKVLPRFKRIEIPFDILARP